MKTVTIGALALLQVGVALADEADRRELGAHEHGHSVLNIAIEGERIEMELMAPGMDIVGFEHAAETDEQASYSKIKSLSDRVRPEQIRAFLGDIAYYEWRALYILMLAQSDDREDRDDILKSFDVAERHHIESNLAAWATAYIEIEGEDAVRIISDRYFRSLDRTDGELVEVIKALSIHGGDGHVHLRDQIIEGYAVLLDSHPSMAGYVAKDLAAWQHWGFAEPLRRIANGGIKLDYPSLFAVGYYLGMAADLRGEQAR